MDSTEEKITALKAQLAAVRAARDRERTAAAEEAEAARLKRQAESSARHQRLLGQMRDISGTLEAQKEEDRRCLEANQEREKARERYRAQKDDKMKELSSSLNALKDGFQRDRERRQADEERAKKDAGEVRRGLLRGAAEQRAALAASRNEIYEDLNRRHEEIKSIVAASASARESASFDDVEDDEGVDQALS